MSGSESIFETGVIVTTHFFCTLKNHLTCVKPHVELSARRSLVHCCARSRVLHSYTGEAGTRRLRHSNVYDFIKSFFIVPVIQSNWFMLDVFTALQ